MSNEQLSARITELEERLFAIEKSDRYILSKLIQIADGRNIQLGRTTGTTIGTATDQKVGFYGATPVVRQAFIADPSGAGTAGVDSPARTAIISILDLLIAYGLMSSS